MKNNLIYYRNELKNKIVPKYKFMGIVAELILSKDIFKRNLDIASFLMNVFSVEYKRYVMISRSLIMARTVQLVANSDEESYKIFKNSLYNEVERLIAESNDSLNQERKKNEFNGWIS